MKAWTDHPIADLGDTPGYMAPIRECNVLSYDRNNQCFVQVYGVVVALDRWSIYKQPSRQFENAEPVDWTALTKLPITLYVTN